MTTADTLAAAALVNRPPHVIRTWAKRGLLTRRGRDARGRTLYDLREVQELAQRMPATDAVASPAWRTASKSS